MPEGHQSPPPERQSGKQLHDPPADPKISREGMSQAVDEEEYDDGVHPQLRRLSSNPEAPMDKYLKEKFARTTGNPCGDHIQ